MNTETKGERRERKARKRRKMAVTGRGLITIIIPLEVKREKERKKK